MTPLERAARALHDIYTDEKERSGAKDMPAWDEMGSDGRYYFEHRARAVLQAIRGPSEHMVKAGGADSEYYNECARESWRDMIDAALEEGPSNQ